MLEILPLPVISAFLPFPDVSGPGIYVPLPSSPRRNLYKFARLDLELMDMKCGAYTAIHRWSAIASLPL